MNLANAINLTNLELGLILVEGSILCLAFGMFRYFKGNGNLLKNRKKNHPLSDQFIELSRESEAVCQSLAKNLEEKREIAQRLMTQLDERIRTLQTLLGNEEENTVLREEKAKPLDLEIYKMAEAGYEVAEIARQLQLSKGEVQLTLDMKRYRQ